MAFDEHNRESILEAPPPAVEGRRPRAVLPRIQPMPAEAAHGDAPPAHGAPAAPLADGEDHFSDALHLVRAAADALERMRARYREAETYAAQQADDYRAELAVAHAGLRDLQEETLAREEKIQRLEAQMRAESDRRRSLEDALKTMSEAAERLREQAQQAQTRATNAEAWLGRFQGEIATAFGELPRLLGEIGQTGAAGAEPDPRGAASR